MLINYRIIRRWMLLGISCSALSLLEISIAKASGFQIWEQDGASIGQYHAGYAAEAKDASTAFYNPAGMTRFKNQQMIFGADGIVTDVKYQGTVSVSTLFNYPPQTVVTQGGIFTPVPFLQYVAPITDDIAFGLSAVVPFGAQLNYHRTTPLQYVSTYNSIKVVDMSPSLAWQFYDGASIGAGPDLQKMSVEFDQIATWITPGANDTSSTNRADDTAWGFHLGGMYQFNANSRVGLSYHSQVAHHLSRRSSFSGPLADPENDTVPIVSRATANITLPPYTALSLYQQINPKFNIMASVIYTQWCTVKNLIMKNLAGVDVDGPTTNLIVVVPQNFKNTWNFSIGGNYLATEKITLKAGLGYDQTPVQNEYRNVQMPDNNRVAVAFGGHYQATQTVGIDLGWNHLFIQNATVSPPTQITGEQQTTTNGSVTAGADVYAAQITWDFV